MSGWTDKDVIAQMLELAHAKPVSDADAKFAVAMDVADQLEQSSNLTLRALGRAGRALSSIAHEINAADERGDHASAMALLNGLILAMAASYSSLLVQPDPAMTAMVKRMFESALAASIVQRKIDMEKGGN